MVLSDFLTVNLSYDHIKFYYMNVHLVQFIFSMWFCWQCRSKNKYFKVCLGLTSLFYIWGHIATVHACSSGTLTKLLQAGMPCCRHRTWHLIRSQYTDIGLICHSVIELFIDVKHYTGIPNYQFKYRGSDQIGIFFPGLPHTPVNALHFDADMAVVS